MTMRQPRLDARDPIRTTVLSRLLLLSDDPRRPSTLLQIDGDGRITDCRRLDPEHADSDQTLPALLVVPGSRVGAVWLDLPARNPVQALAAARIMLNEHTAAGGEAPHVAIAPPPTTGKRLVAVVEPATMQDWLDRAAALGVQPEAMVPDHLMLAPAEDAVRGIVLDDRWVLRGEQLAFSAEPALATLVLGDRLPQLIDDRDQVERILAESTPAIDLLQDRFARRSRTDRQQRGYRRAAWMALALLLSPVVLWSAQALRYELAARRMQAQAQTLVRNALPGYGAVEGAPDRSIDNPAAVARSHLAGLKQGDGFTRSAGALFGAVAALDGVHLETLSYSADGLRATLTHPATADLESLRTGVARAGFELQASGTRRVADGLRSTVVLRAGQ